MASTRRETPYDTLSRQEARAIAIGRSVSQRTRRFNELVKRIAADSLLCRTIQRAIEAKVYAAKGYLTRSYAK